MKIALVSSVGGHLSELLELAAGLHGHELVWILNDRSPVLPEGVRAYQISHAERDWRVVWNVVELAAIFARERPDALLSCGAGPAIPAGVIAKVAGIPYIYVEGTWAARELTLTGKLTRWLTPHVFVQWDALKARYPWARYDGGLL